MLCRNSIVEYFQNHDKLLAAINTRRFTTLIDRDYGLQIHVFRGVDRDYLVSPCNICTCSDFIINFIGRKREYPCYHVVGFAIAEKQGKLSYVELDHNTLVTIVSEVVFLGISPRLRKIIRS